MRRIKDWSLEEVERAVRSIVANRNSKPSREFMDWHKRYRAGDTGSELDWHIIIGHIKFLDLRVMRVRCQTCGRFAKSSISDVTTPELVLHQNRIWEDGLEYYRKDWAEEKKQKHIWLL